MRCRAQWCNFSVDSLIAPLLILPKLLPYVIMYTLPGSAVSEMSKLHPWRQTPRHYCLFFLCPTFRLQGRHPCHMDTFSLCFILRWMFFLSNIHFKLLQLCFHGKNTNNNLQNLFFTCTMIWFLPLVDNRFKNFLF